MAEIDFFAASGDLGQIADILEREYQCRFEVDGGALRSPKPIASSSQVVRHVERSRYGARFAVISPLWERYPISRTEHSKGSNPPKYSISFRDGGPSIDLLARLPERRDAIWLLIPSLLSDFPTYYPTDSRGARTDGAAFARPLALTNAMSSLRKHIRSRGVRTQTARLPKPGPWALPEALELHGQGMVLRIGDHEYKPRREG